MKSQTPRHMVGHNPMPFDINSIVENPGEQKSGKYQLQFPGLGDIFKNLANQVGKKSFLVLKSNRYVNVLSENIAFFYIRYEATMIMCFDKQEFFVDHSLEKLQKLLSPKQFYRLNRQYLINFNAIQDVEHYFARKLLVNPTINVKDKLIVSKEKVSEFLHWLDNR
jgi:two-component system, LytTR family, response regulator LytT